MSSVPSLNVFLLSGDLLFASKVKSNVESLGGRFAMGGNLPVEDCDDLSHVVLDLSTRSGLASSLKEICEDRCPSARLIAYGLHVMVDRLKAARDGGIETVLTNGQFDGAMRVLFNEEPAS
jgi:hypothetical protein